LGLSLTARILLESSGLNYIAYTILLMGLLSLARDYQIRKMGIWGRIYFWNMGTYLFFSFIFL
jgi:MscS family membrane protein